MRLLCPRRHVVGEHSTYSAVVLCRQLPFIQVSSSSLYAMLGVLDYSRSRLDPCLTILDSCPISFRPYPSPRPSYLRVLDIILVDNASLCPHPSLAVYPPHSQLLVTLQPLMRPLPLVVYSQHPWLLVMSPHSRRCILYPWPSILRIPGSSLRQSSATMRSLPCPSSWSPLSRILDMFYRQCILVFALCLNLELLWHTSATSFSFPPSSRHSHITAVHPFNLSTIRSDCLQNGRQF